MRPVDVDADEPVLGEFDEPTQLMPAASSEPEPEQPDLLEWPPATASPNVAVPPPGLVHAPARRPSRERAAGFLFGSVVVGLVVIAFVAGALAATGNLDFRGLLALVPRPPSPSRVVGSPSAPPAATPTSTAVPVTGFSCAPRDVAAGAPGKWDLHRAVFGTKAKMDYVALQLQRAGSADATANVHAELVAAPSNGDMSLVLQFAGPVVIQSAFGGNPDYPALKDLHVDKSPDGNVTATLGIKGSGCFSLDGTGWGDGDSAEIDVQIQQP